jgi:hypothetical protein
MRYRVKRIAPGSLGKFGCVMGALISFLPSLVLAAGGMLVVGGLRRLLEGWQQAEIRLLGQAIPIDAVALLNLESSLRTVRMLDSLSWGAVVTIVVVGCAVGGLLFLVVSSLGGWLYNLVAALSGGLEVELVEGRNLRRGKR